MLQVLCFCPNISPDSKGKDFAGFYEQVYTNNHTDSTTVHCDGNITWRGNKKKGKLYLAGSKLPADRASQNNDTNYKAEDGYGCDCVVGDSGMKNVDLY